MTDNLGIKGIQDDGPVGSRRLKPRGKQKKPWVIEWRIKCRGPGFVARVFGLRDWSVYSRYTTESRRDQALAVLVKKTERDRNYAPWHSFPEYRKRDDQGFRKCDD